MIISMHLKTIQASALKSCFEVLKDALHDVNMFFTPTGMSITALDNAKAALISGPPGIGKTSACRIICKHLGFEVMEMNASDCRSKLAIQSGITTLSTNKSIDYWTVAG